MTRAPSTVPAKAADACSFAIVLDNAVRPYWACGTAVTTSSTSFLGPSGLGWVLVNESIDNSLDQRCKNFASRVRSSGTSSVSASMPTVKRIAWTVDAPGGIGGGGGDGGAGGGDDGGGSGGGISGGNGIIGMGGDGGRGGEAGTGGEGGGIDGGDGGVGRIERTEMSTNLRSSWSCTGVKHVASEVTAERMSLADTPANQGRSAFTCTSIPAALLLS